MKPENVFALVVLALLYAAMAWCAWKAGDEADMHFYGALAAVLVGGCAIIVWLEMMV